MDHALAALRAQAIDRDDLLSSLPSAALQACARLAAHVTGLASAGIHLLGDQLLQRVAAHQAPLGSWPLSGTPCLRVVETGEPVHLEDAYDDATFRDGPIRSYAGTPISDRQGVVVGTVCGFGEEPASVSPSARRALDEIGRLLSELVALRRTHAELTHSATHDPLTGLPNRSLLSDHLVRAMSRRERRPGEPVVAVVDLDGFKQINDRYGHATGDRVLIAVAERLRQGTRGADLVARLAGDEFVVILDQLPADADVGTVVADLEQRLRECLEAPLRIGELVLSVGASVGAASSDPGELSYGVLGRADTAMFEDKRRRDAAR